MTSGTTAQEEVDKSKVPQFTFFLYDHLGNSRILFSNEILDCENDSILYLLEHVIDYYPYGKTLREYVHERERFQTTYHERDIESGLDYRGARFYDGDVGRFLSTDPKALDFASWSTYNYSLGNPVKFIDPDGKAPISADPPDRKYLAISVLKETNYRTGNMSHFRPDIRGIDISGGINDLTNTLTNASSGNSEISFLALFSHGVPNTIWGDGGSISTSDLSTLQSAITNNEVNFSPDAVIYLGGCNCGTESSGETFAQELADITGATVYAMVDDSVAPVKESTGNASNPVMSYGASHDPKGSKFNVFTAGGTPSPIGTNSLDVLQLFDTTKRGQAQRDWNSQKAEEHKSQLLGNF